MIGASLISATLLKVLGKKWSLALHMWMKSLCHRTVCGCQCHYTHITTQVRMIPEQTVRNRKLSDVGPSQSSMSAQRSWAGPVFNIALLAISVTIAFIRTLIITKRTAFHTTVIL